MVEEEEDEEEEEEKGGGGVCSPASRTASRPAAILPILHAEERVSRGGAAHAFARTHMCIKTISDITRGGLVEGRRKRQMPFVLRDGSDVLLS
jgi:hypothetical protein